MGQQNVDGVNDTRDLRTFTRAVLADLRALEQMLDTDVFERGVRRIGAEQEMFLIDGGNRPAPKAVEMLATLNNPAFTTELARFNLEANLPPYVFGGDCLRRMERDLLSLLGKARTAAAANDCAVLLTGILPTLRLPDLGLHNMTPVARYAQINQAILKLSGGRFRVRIKGTDELDVEHDNVMLEACNTSFQVHFQVAPEEFAKLYNLAQAVTGPVLAAAVNSPILLQKRLWHETRVALFQHSVDDRSHAHRARGRRTRVRFGDAWLRDSVTELFRDDIARFRVLLGAEVGEDPMAVLARGEVPELSALRLHNGTVYRWNRPCYGVADGKAHLRIENRVLPAGPTVLDEVANAAFFYGLMASVSEAYGDVTQAMDFDDVKGNFVAAARQGLQAQFHWVGGATHTASDLILKELLPLARQGLASRNLDGADIDRYLGVLEERVKAQRTGARWALESLARMPGTVTKDERMRALVSATMTHQLTEAPVHTWPLATFAEQQDWRHSYERVGQFMTDDVYTVRPDDLVDLAANLMDWVHVRHIPVEDDDGRLVGLVTHRRLLRLLGENERTDPDEPVAVRDIMDLDPPTVTPDTPTVDAIALMRDPEVKCLPVCDQGQLVGIVTERDLFDLATRLLERELRDFRKRP